tara:strand:- start:2628 stop:2771 length:144 start_codon:yes stop_codon:yes gene_type:complete
MADGMNRTDGEKARDEIYIKLLQGIFKSLEQISANLVEINKNLSNKK